MYIVDLFAYLVTRLLRHTHTLQSPDSVNKTWQIWGHLQNLLTTKMFLLGTIKSAEVVYTESLSCYLIVIFVERFPHYTQYNYNWVFLCINSQCVSLSLFTLPTK
jgi:hypothetical protein